MLKLHLEQNASWRRRFYSSYLFYTYIAAANQAHGVVSGKIEGDTFQLYAWDVMTGDLRKLTDNPIGVYFGWLTPDAASLFYLRDDTGDEHGHLSQIDYASGKQRNVTPDLAPFTLRGCTICRSGERIAFNAVDEMGYRYYRIDLKDGECTDPKLIFSTETETWDAHLSHDGELLAVKSTARAGGKRNYSTLIYDMSGLQVAELWDDDEASVVPAMFSPLADDSRLLATTSRSGFQHPLVWDIATNTRRELDTSTLAGDVQPIDWSADGKQLLLRQTYQANLRLYLYDLETDKLIHLNHPEGGYTGQRSPYSGGLSATYFGTTGHIWTQWSNSATPPQLIELDKTSGEKNRVVLSVADVPAGRPDSSVVFPSSDGTAIQAWLSTPAGEAPYPTVISLHGGPHIHIPAGFAPISQVWLDHGFAHLTVNYRGSSGFGQKFQNQIIGDIGHWELEDIIAARDWLIGQGIAKRDEIILSGGSYGGYLVILALAKQPTLWRAGVAKAAVVDWIDNYADCSEAVKGLTRNLFGGAPADIPKAYRAASPIHIAEQIAAPLLIYQAQNDSRTTQRQMEKFVAKMVQLDKFVEIVWLTAGHNSGSTTALQEQLVGELKFVRDALQKPLKP